VLRSHGGYRLVRTSVYDGPAGGNTLWSQLEAHTRAVHALAVATESVACEAHLGSTVGELLVTPGIKRKCCAHTEATGLLGRVYMMALPVVTLSDHSLKPIPAPCTRSRSPQNLLRARLILAAQSGNCWSRPASNESVALTRRLQAC